MQDECRAEVKEKRFHLGGEICFFA
jgi:hypothetical protein